MIIVLNEWVFHDLIGENGVAAQREAATFLNAFYSSSDKLVMPAEPRWMRKAYQLMTQADPMLRHVSKQFQYLLRDSGRTIDSRRLDEMDIPKRLLEKLPEEDAYLVSAHLSDGADKLITTDQGLFDPLTATDLISCEMRDEFLDAYMA